MCFVVGGIITVIFSKILEWQRYQNPHEERGEGRIMVPIQEVGDGEREEERIVQEYTVQKNKVSTRTRRTLRYCYERLLFTFFSQNLKIV